MFSQEVGVANQMLVIDGGVTRVNFVVEDAVVSLIYTLPVTWLTTGGPEMVIAFLEQLISLPVIDDGAPIAAPIAAPVAAPIAAPIPAPVVPAWQAMNTTYFGGDPQMFVAALGFVPHRLTCKLMASIVKLMVLKQGCASHELQVPQSLDVHITLVRVRHIIALLHATRSIYSEAGIDITKLCTCRFNHRNVMTKLAASRNALTEK